MQNFKLIALMQDGKYYALEAQVVASGDAAEVDKLREEMGSINLTLLPHETEVSCAAFARLEDRRLFVMYMPAARRTVLWKNKYTEEKRQFIVWMPHLYLGIFFRGGGIENGFAMVSKKKLTTLDQKLSMLPLPNVAKPYGHICEGKEGKWLITADPSETAVSYTKYFMQSEYISDINQHFPYVPKLFWPPGWSLDKKLHEDAFEECNQGVLSLWQQLSETNLEGVKNADWREEFSLRDLVKATWMGVVGPDQYQFVNNVVGLNPIVPAGPEIVAQP